MAKGQSRRNRKLVPSCEKMINQWKYEIAAELGIPVGNPAANANVEFAGELGSIPVSSGSEEYWGHIASRDAGAVGGQITRRLVQQAEELMYGLKS